MNNFLGFTLFELKRSLMFGSGAAALCALFWGGFYVAFKRKHRDERERSFPWCKAFWSIVFCGYVAVLLYITLFRTASYGYRTVNLHLFRAWREAWNHFSLKNWLNVLLNIGLFVPLGALLPLLSKRFQKWYVTPGAGFAVSLALEAMQRCLSRGLFDVDDLFANTLGTTLGFCAVMLLMNLFFMRGTKRWQKSFAYAAIPLITLTALLGIGVAYYAQPYGNLEDAAAFMVNTKNVKFVLQCDLGQPLKKAGVYRTEPYSQESCNEFGDAFFERINAVYDDVAYYDHETYFMAHASPAHFLMVSHLDRSYEYSYIDYADVEWAEISEAALRQKLLAYGIELPQSATFTYEGDGWHKFSVVQLIKGETMTDGTVLCRCTAQGTLRNIENKMVSYTFCCEDEIISPEKAYERLCKGQISDGDCFEAIAPESVIVTACGLEYRVDTKGFYQPVYVFSLFSEDGGYSSRCVIPAIQ